MKEDPGLTDTLFKRVTEYNITYIELIKLRTINKIIKVISAIFPDFIVSAFFVVFLLFVNLGLAFWLGDALGKVYFGFLLVSAFYFFLGLFSHFFFRGWFKKAIANYFIRKFFR
jgi:hypothetical protein